ncbi:MAG TPA: O-antigen ligase family protein [Saprospiraceae bacterium]|nr:O-antigen ligase family protein [Saprospiraceae bacterium]
MIKGFWKLNDVEDIQDKTHGNDTGLPQYFFILFGLFVLIFIPNFQLSFILDYSLLPRMSALSLFLGLIAVLFYYPSPVQPRSFAPVGNPVFIILGAYLVISFLAMLLSSMFTEGLGDWVRSTLLAGMVLISTIILHNTQHWQTRIPIIILIASFIAISMGTIQYLNEVVFNPDQLLPDGRPTIYAVTGRMSHKNEFSNAMMWMIPFLSYGVYKWKIPLKVFGIFALCSLITLIILLKTRAVWLGILTASYLFSLLMVIFHEKIHIPSLLRKILITGMIAAPLSLLVIYLLGKPADDFSIMGRLYSFFDTQSPHNIFRLKVWSGTWNLITDHFWWGIGPGMWKTLFLPYLSGAFSDMTQTVWGRPHNDFLWVFAEKGVFGFLAFCSFFAALFMMGWQIVQRSSDRDTVIMILLYLSALIAYIVISFFAFPLERVNNIVYIGIVSSGIIVEYHKLFGRNKQINSLRLVFLPALLFFLFGFYYSVEGIEQEKNMAQWEFLMNREEYSKALYFAEQSRNPMIKLDIASRSADEMIALSLERMGNYKKSMEALDKALILFPEKPRMLNQKAVLYFQMGEFEKALPYARRAREIVPGDKKLNYDLAAILLNLNLEQEALEVLQSIPNPLRYPDVMRVINHLNSRLELKTIEE